MENTTIEVRITRGKYRGELGRLGPYTTGNNVLVHIGRLGRVVQVSYGSLTRYGRVSLPELVERQFDRWGEEQS